MIRGRARLGGAALLAIVAVVLGAVGAGSPTAVGQTPPSVPGVPKVPRGTVSYLLHAQFAVDLQVTWDELQGDPDAPCSSWREDSGKSEVVAGTWTETKDKLDFHWVPGSAKIYPRTQGNPKLGGGWANLTALGKATATFSRTWKQDGGSNWTPDCGGSEPGLFRPSPNDCAGGRERSSAAKNASLLAVMRDGETSLLKAIITNQTPGTQAAKVPAFQVDVPMAAPYRRCMSSRYGIGIPASLALLAPKKTPQAWVTALRKLKPGKWKSFKGTYTGTCDPDQAERYTCEFKLTVIVTIRRVGPGITYP